MFIDTRIHLFNGALSCRQVTGQVFSVLLLIRALNVPVALSAPDQHTFLLTPLSRIPAVPLIPIVIAAVIPSNT